ncbi:MAG: hypothetical protein ACK4P4_15260 [Allorhizobium sp.]
MQDDLIQLTHDGIAEDRARFVILDDRLKEVEVTRDEITWEIPIAEWPVENYEGKIEKLKAQFNAQSKELGIRKLIFLARNKADEAVN